MFCPPEEKTGECADVFSMEDYHWCAYCKFGGCDWCCGCPECNQNKRGGWSPRGTQVNHDGIRSRKTEE